MNQLVALACIISIVAYGWPSAQDGLQRLALVLIATFFPIVGWVIIVRRGHRARIRRAAARALDTRVRRSRERREALEFQRHMLTHGTPVEQENARTLLADYQAEQPSPLLAHLGAPVIVVNDERDFRYLQTVAGQQVFVVNPLPSGRVLTREERHQVRFEPGGALYIPTHLTQATRPSVELHLPASVSPDDVPRITDEANRIYGATPDSSTS